MARQKTQSEPSSTTICPSLPSGWRMVRFDEIAENVAERVDPAEADAEVYVGLEHLDSESLKIRRWGAPSDVIGDKLRFHKGDIIFGKRRAYQRKLAVAELEGICSAHAMVVRAKPEVVDPAFLPFLMQSDMFMSRAQAISVGSLSPTINWKTLRIQEFPLPPKDEQCRIADILWRAVENVESRVCVANRMQASWQLMIDSIVPNPDQAGPDRTVRLDSLCAMQNGRPFQSSEYSQSGVKLLRPGNLGHCGRLQWSLDSTVYLDQRHAEENRNWIVRPGDVVINLTAQSLEDGFMGRVCLAGSHDESLLNQRLGRFLCNDDVHPEIIFRLLQTTRFRRIVESRCEGSKVRHTYFRHFADMPVVSLRPDEQRTVIDNGRQIDSARDAAAKAVSMAKQLQSQLREHLLGGADFVH